MRTVLAETEAPPGSRQEPVRRFFSCKPDAADAVADIRRQLAGADPAFVIMFVAPSHDLDRMAEAVRREFEDIPVIGATSAGEISPRGYEVGSITGAAFEKSHFDMAVDLIEDTQSYQIEEGRAFAQGLLRRLDVAAAAARSDVFALLLTDGLSQREEALVAGLASGLGPAPLLGGSAGDGLEFHRTYVFHEGRFRRNAAQLAVVRSRCPFRVFKFDHFDPTEVKMVVTGADAEQRLVTEINAEPAAEEYARLLGLDVSELSPFVFAANPLVVRVGGSYHVRSIQKVEPDGGLRLLCAIDEGLVLSIAQARHLSTDLEESLGRLRAELGPPSAMLTFDCVLRRLEAERTQQTRPLSETLARYNAIGFCTYGEQFRSMHVNQTLIGVYFFDPERREAADAAAEETRLEAAL